MNVNWLLRRAKTLLNVLLFALLLKYPCKYAWHIVYKVFAWIQYQSPNGYSGDYNYSSEVAAPPLPFPSYPGRGREWINRAFILVPVDPPPTAKIVGYGTKYLSFFTSLSYFNISIHHKIHYTEKNLNFSEIILNFLPSLL